MKKIQYLTLISTLMLIVVSCASYNKINDNKKYSEVVWLYKTRANIFSSPALDKNGNIIFGTAGKGVFALDNNANMIWNYTLQNKGNKTKANRQSKPNAFYSSPSIGDDGTIYIGSDRGELIALHPDGSFKWSFITPNEILATPAIGKDYIVVATRDSKLYAISFEGEQLWYFNSKAPFTASPVIADNGRIFIGAEDGNFYAINPDGSSKWVYGTSGKITAGSVLNQTQDTIYFANTAGAIFALDTETAQLIWFNDDFRSIYSTPVRDKEGNIYVIDNIGYLVKFSADGEVLSSYECPGAAFATPALTEQGSLYVLTVDKDAGKSYLMIFGTDLSFKWLKSFTSDLRSSPVIADNGRVYFGSRLGKLYAIQGLGEAPSPNQGAMFAANRTHTGRFDVVEGEHVVEDTSNNTNATGTQ